MYFMYEVCCLLSLLKFVANNNLFDLFMVFDIELLRVGLRSNLHIQQNSQRRVRFFF